MCMLIALYSLRESHRRLMSWCSRFLWVLPRRVLCRSVRGALSTVRGSALLEPRHHAAGPARRHVCARRVRDIRAWGAGAPRDRVRCRSGRVRRTRPPWPSASVPATTRNNSRLAARSRHPMQVRTGRAGWREGIELCNHRRTSLPAWGLYAEPGERPGRPARRRPARPRSAAVVGASSERMSIRQPVSRAASRAF